MQEAWEDVTAPWFDQVLPGAWQRELPSMVIVPTRGQADDIKARLIASGRSHLGLQFVPPSTLRAVLSGMMLLRMLSLNFCVCFSQSPPLKSKIDLTNLKRLLPRLLRVPLHSYCEH